MSEWDSAAEAHLGRVVSALREASVVDVLADEVRATWAANLKRYEPRELGDTPQLLGLLCAGNLGQRVVRRYSDLHGGGPDPLSVRASLPDNSLLVQACGVQLQTRKAPGEALSPDWSGFSWEESAGVRRHAAAAANSASYRPAASDQDGRAHALDDGGLWSLDDPEALRHVTLVWAGDPEGERTSGWLGFPCLGSPGWFAVTQLWRDASDERPGTARETPEPAVQGADTFTDRPEPALGLGLRRRAAQEEERA